MNNNNISKKSIFMVFAAGCLLGILCFVLVYGVKILNPTYDAWLMTGDVDLKQHYLGFCHLRKNSIRTFPLGIISTLSKPFDMSVIYTDSIPLFALFFRLLSKFIPQHFQYFGMFGIISFALMGGFSSVLIRRFTEKYAVIFGGSLFFILSYPVLQRMYYHTALAAQWIIILALVIWFYKDITRFSTWLCWFILGALCVSIHSYYVFFTGLILLMQVVEYYINYFRNKRETGSINTELSDIEMSDNKDNVETSGNKYNNKTSESKGNIEISGNKYNIKKTGNKENLEKSSGNENKAGRLKITPVISIIMFAGSAFAALYSLGAFYGAGEMTKGGFGDFNGNLNGFINPGEYSVFFKPMKYNGMFEYEGYGYVGIGILLIIIAAVVYALVKVFTKNKKDEDHTLTAVNRQEENTQQASKAENHIEENNQNTSVVEKNINIVENNENVAAADNYIKINNLTSTNNLKQLDTLHYVTMFVLVVISLILATMPRFSFNEYRLLNIPLPASLKHILGICRTNGRFIWIGTYLIILLSLIFISRLYDRTWVKCLFMLALVLQLSEMSGSVIAMHNYYSTQKTYSPIFMEPEAQKILSGKKQFVFMYNGDDLRLDTAYTAYLKRMTQNTFYYARPIDDAIMENIEKTKADFLNGKISKKSVYIFRNEDYTPEYRNAVIVHGAAEYLFSDHVAVVLQ